MGSVVATKFIEDLLALLVGINTRRQTPMDLLISKHDEIYECSFQVVVKKNKYLEIMATSI